MKPFLVLLVAGSLIAGISLIEPIAQNPSYHQFADTRRLLGIPNFWNVATNVLFLISGTAGLRYLSDPIPGGILPSLLPIYRTFFAGILFTAIGSGWYHLGPANESLVWDRLPMTLAFMSLFAIVIGELVSVTLGRRLFVPLLLAGAGSVIYWWQGENVGSGDLRPYVLVQFLPMILIPLILLLYKSGFDRSGFIWGMIFVYAVSKLLEYTDYNVFDAGALISGHSLKHLVAAAAPLLFLHGLKTRQPLPNSDKRLADVPDI